MLGFHTFLLVQVGVEVVLGPDARRETIEGQKVTLCAFLIKDESSERNETKVLMINVTSAVSRFDYRRVQTTVRNDHPKDKLMTRDLIEPVISVHRCVFPLSDRRPLS